MTRCRPPSPRFRGPSIRPGRNTRPRCLIVERDPEGLTGTRQAGHDGSDRNLHDVSQLSIRQLLELAKHEQFTKTIWQVLHRSLDQGDVVGVEQQRFRILGDWTSPAVLFFVERIGRRASWAPAKVVVTGAGPIGLLAAMLGVQRGLDVHVFDIDMSLCCYCNLCTYPCPTFCIYMTPEYEFATDDLTQHLYHFAKKDAAFLTEDPKKKAVPGAPALPSSPEAHKAPTPAEAPTPGPTPKAAAVTPKTMTAPESAPAEPAKE